MKYLDPECLQLQAVVWSLRASGQAALNEAGSLLLSLSPAVPITRKYLQPSLPFLLSFTIWFFFFFNKEVRCFYKRKLFSRVTAAPPLQPRASPSTPGHDAAARQRPPPPPRPERGEAKLSPLSQRGGGQAGPSGARGQGPRGWQRLARRRALRAGAEVREEEGEGGGGASRQPALP